MAPIRRARLLSSPDPARSDHHSTPVRKTRPNQWRCTAAPEPQAVNRQRPAAFPAFVHNARVKDHLRFRERRAPSLSIFASRQRISACGTKNHGRCMGGHVLHLSARTSGWAEAPKAQRTEVFRSVLRRARSLPLQKLQRFTVDKMGAVRVGS